MLGALSSSVGVKVSCRDEVYVGAVALRASKGPSQLLMSASYSLNLHHFIVIVKRSSPPPQVLVYDFQPEDPESIWVAVAALTGRDVPGVILVRKLEKLPKRKCQFVGYSRGNTIIAAQEFNESWETNLKIGHHDCRHYCQGLVEHLTGEKAVLEDLSEGYFK
ncbi:Unknown protein [Striga hermonthica]|uniref:Uncharacterized protein n=1 Tax=Striga hermonthica TaxID=68872 RepID=A0A9N7RN88_STRHE|nr:Unknown protein [Striga hermonthica]